MASPNITFDPAKWQQVLAALRIGNARGASHRYVGIANSTFYNWLKNGANYLNPDNRDEILYISGAELTTQVEQAEAAAEVAMITHLQNLTKANPDVIFKRLALRNPDDWKEKPTSKVEVELTDNTLDAQDFQVKVEAAANAAAAQLAAKAAADPTPDEAEGK